MLSRSHAASLGKGIVLLGFLFACGGARGQELGNIAGQIRMQNASLPPQQIMVTLEGRGAIINTAYCDNEGRFGFYNLLSNPYYVVIDAEGYEPIRQQVVVVPTISQTNIVHIVLRPVAVAPSRASPGSLTNPDVVDVSELAKNFPASVIKVFEAGRKAEQRGEMDAAVRLYEAALHEAPDFYPALNNLGIRHLQKGEVKAAEAEFRRVIELNQNGAQAYFNLGNVLYMTQRSGEAKQTLEVGLRLSPSNAMGHYLNGSVLARLGDFKAAEEELKTARELDPKMPQVTISLATLYLQSGREHEAAAMFEAFLKEFPKDPMVPKVRAALSKIAQSSSP
jgi:Flp pilus assembly protein TadD